MDISLLPASRTANYNFTLTGAIFFPGRSAYLIFRQIRGRRLGATSGSRTVFFNRGSRNGAKSLRKTRVSNLVAWHDTQIPPIRNDFLFAWSPNI